MARSNTAGAPRVPDATAAPPAIKASVAGTGSPIASTKTIRKIMVYPWCVAKYEKFYKRGSQEKTRSHRREFFFLPSPVNRARGVLSCRAMVSDAGRCGPGGLGFFYQRFSSAVRDEASQF